MISALRKQGMSTAKIAKQLGRHKAPYIEKSNVIPLQQVLQ